METYNLSDLSGKTLRGFLTILHFLFRGFEKKDKKKFISVVANGLV